MINRKYTNLALATGCLLLLSACATSNASTKHSGHQSNTPKSMLNEAESSPILDGVQSEPVGLGIMQGFPPPADKTINILNARDFPQLRWTFSNIPNLAPTKVVASARENLYKFPVELDGNIGKIKFMPQFLPADQTQPITVEDAFVRKVYGDSMIVLHDGKIVYETTPNKAYDPIDGTHILMSVTKSFTGTLAAQLAHEGVIDASKPVTYYVPELAKSAWGDATVRQVMDMTASLDYSEDYADPNSDINAFSKSMLPVHPSNYKGPKSMYEFLTTVKKDTHPHDTGFEYKTVNTDVLAWIIARATGKSVNVLFSELFFKPMGMNVDAYMLVDSAGSPFAGGGMSMNLRDMAMFGEMMRNNGRFNGKQIVSPSVAADIMRGGDRAKFATGGYPNLKGWSYRNMWWVTHNDHGAYMARGVHGQAIYIDPAAKMVIVRFSSNPVASNAHNDPWSLPAYQAVAEYLMKR